MDVTLLVCVEAFLPKHLFRKHPAEDQSTNCSCLCKSTKVFDLASRKGRTAIGSGAVGGIGLAVAHAYAETGANVILWYDSNKDADDWAKEIEAEHGVKRPSTSLHPAKPFLNE